MADTQSNANLAANRPASDAAVWSRYVGRHLLVDMHGVAREQLQDADGLLALLLSALYKTGFHVVQHSQHRFPGPHGGSTAVVLLSESHATYHTYPEFGYIALDVFSCGQGADPEALMRLIAETLMPERIDTHLEHRGRM